ncbi:hypothetical protein B5X24_HaOG214393 [Helicoverpa armigera]|nr:hypothetical protein B5X24_HaOG214393 [Helicoverpa armigera]
MLRKFGYDLDFVITSKNACLEKFHGERTVTNSGRSFRTRIILICELSLLLSASGIGLYYRALTERAHRNTFAGTRTCLEQRVKLECEREQQERLLLSVIPAYIAAEYLIILILIGMVADTQ